MNDSINREIAIKAIEEDKINLTNPTVKAIAILAGNFEKAKVQVMTCDRHIKILKNLPSTQPEQRWIPVTERMPNEEYCTDWGVQRSGPVLVTVVDGEDVFVDMCCTVNGAWPLLHKVTAWMPLPAPYQKENTNE